MNFILYKDYIFILVLYIFYNCFCYCLELALRLEKEKQCEKDARWRKDCNWCDCVNDQPVCTQNTCRTGKVTQR